MFTADKGELVAYPPGKKGGSYEVPEGTVTLGEKAFAGAHLTEISIPDTVEEIGKGAFSECSSSLRLLFAGSSRATELSLVSSGESIPFDSSTDFAGPRHFNREGILRVSVETTISPEILGGGGSHCPVRARGQ